MKNGILLDLKDAAVLRRGALGFSLLFISILGVFYGFTPFVAVFLPFLSVVYVLLRSNGLKIKKNDKVLVLSTLVSFTLPVSFVSILLITLDPFVFPSLSRLYFEFSDNNTYFAEWLLSSSFISFLLPEFITQIGPEEVFGTVKQGGLGDARGHAYIISYMFSVIASLVFLLFNIILPLPLYKWISEKCAFRTISKNIGVMAVIFFSSTMLVASILYNLDAGFSLEEIKAEQPNMELVKIADRGWSGNTGLTYNNQNLWFSKGALAKSILHIVSSATLLLFCAHGLCGALMALFGKKREK